MNLDEKLLQFEIFVFKELSSILSMSSPSKSFSRTEEERGKNSAILNSGISRQILHICLCFPKALISFRERRIKMITLLIKKEALYSVYKFYFYRGFQIYLLSLIKEKITVYPCRTSSGFIFHLLNQGSLQERLKNSISGSNKSQFVSHSSRYTCSCSFLLHPHCYSSSLLSYSIPDLFGSRNFHEK